MKKLIAAAAALCIVPLSAWTQEADRHYPLQGYFLFGVGTGPSFQFGPYPYGGSITYHSMQIALGGEAISKPGLGLGFEMGWTSRGYRPRVRTPSLDVTFHFPKPARGKFEPFVHVGATLMYQQFNYGRGAAAANFGGGVNWWFVKHLALRCDVKRFWHDNVTPDYPNLLEFRFGVAFR